MKKNYILLIISSLIFSIQLFSQKPNYIISANDLCKIQSYGERMNISNSNIFDEIIDSSTIYMRIDTEYHISPEIFWDTLYFFYYKYDDKGRPKTRSSETLLNTYYSGIKQVFEKAEFFFDNNDRFIKEVSLRERAGDFDTLTFKNYYTDFNELDSITLEVKYQGKQYFVRNDIYEYDENNILQNIKRYVLDDDGNWVLGVLFTYEYSYPDIDKPSTILTEEYYQGEVVYSNKENYFYNSYNQIDSVYVYFNDLGKGWQYSHVEDHFYSDSNQKVPDSIRYYDIKDGSKDFESVQYFFKRNGVGTKNIVNKKCNCSIPNPYREGQFIDCFTDSDIIHSNAKVNIYNLNGILIQQLPYSDKLTLSNINNTGQYIFTIKKSSGELLFSKPFVFLQLGI